MNLTLPHCGLFNVKNLLFHMLVQRAALWEPENAWNNENGFHCRLCWHSFLCMLCLNQQAPYAIGRGTKQKMQFMKWCIFTNAGLGGHLILITVQASWKFLGMRWRIKLDDFVRDCQEPKAFTSPQKKCLIPTPKPTLIMKEVKYSLKPTKSLNQVGQFLFEWG